MEKAQKSGQLLRIRIQNTKCKRNFFTIIPFLQGARKAFLEGESFGLKGILLLTGCGENGGELVV